MAQNLAKYSRVSDSEDGASSHGGSASGKSGHAASSSSPESPLSPQGPVVGAEGEVKKKEPTFFEIVWVLRPYFWPNSGSDGAFINRVRAVSTWVTVICSKLCNLAAPIFLSAAANGLTSMRFGTAVRSLVIYCILRVGSSFFKEMQSIIYVKVKQQASIELVS
jgi:hypothetical protein